MKSSVWVVGQVSLKSKRPKRLNLKSEKKGRSLFRRHMHHFSREEGSISVLTIGLFSIAIALLILITDIASISVSKQSLVHATEAAAVRAVHNVDLGSYYRGDSGVSVPIDCQKAYQVVADELAAWLHDEGDIKRRELQEVSLTRFSCSGDRVELSTSARTLLPFRLPQGSALVELHATVEAQSERIP